MTKEKTTVKPQRPVSKTSTKPKEPKKSMQKAKTPTNVKKPNAKVEPKQKLETPIEPIREPIVETPVEYQEELTIEDKEEQETEYPGDSHEETSTKNEVEQENRTDDEQPLENHNYDNEYLLESEQQVATGIDETLEPEISTHEIEQDDSLPIDTEERTEEKLEPDDISADELDENIELPNDNTRPESISLNNYQNENFVDSNPSSPIVEIKSPSSPQDPMTKGFVEGVSETDNPFEEQTNHFNNQDENEDVEIIQHDISASEKRQVLSDEEIDPQGLPIETKPQPNKSSR